MARKFKIGNQTWIHPHVRVLDLHGSTPMKGFTLDSENHILRDEITHARYLAWGGVAKVIPMSNP